MPRVAASKKELDTRELAGPAKTEVHIPLEEEAEVHLEVPRATDGFRIGDHAAELKFMEEKVIIRIHPSVEPYPEDPVMVGVNGSRVYIPRNKNCIVRRKYVERLARAKVEKFTQDVRSPIPEVMNKLTREPAQKYPFSVIRDDNPRGADWLMQILQEPA